MSFAPDSTTRKSTMSELSKKITHTISVASDTAISTTLFVSAPDCHWIYSHGFELVWCSYCKATNNQQIVICELSSQEGKLTNAIEKVIWNFIFESTVTEPFA